MSYQELKNKLQGKGRILRPGNFRQPTIEWHMDEHGIIHKTVKYTDEEILADDLEKCLQNLIFKHIDWDAVAKSMMSNFGPGNVEVTENSADETSILVYGTKLISTWVDSTTDEYMCDYFPPALNIREVRTFFDSIYDNKMNVPFEVSSDSAHNFIERYRVIS
jgi:hypothetical protein